MIAMRLGAALKGYANLVLELRARKVVELEIVDSISYETVRRTLKKNGMTNRKMESWVIPPESEAEAEFLASIDDILDMYAMCYDPDCPVLCMDEQPVQLFKET